jgi:hypothetical protein
MTAHTVDAVGIIERGLLFTLVNALSGTILHAYVTVGAVAI